MKILLIRIACALTRAAIFVVFAVGVGAAARFFVWLVLP